MLLLLWCGLTQAKNVVTFNATVIEGPPCIINNGQVIEVNFGDDLQTTRIDGVNYSKNIDYTLDCGNTENSGLRMQIKGAATLFDNKLLAAEGGRGSILGIGFKANSVTLPVNTWLDLGGKSKPSLSAVPVGTPDMIQPPGDFSAAATMLFEYK